MFHKPKSLSIIVLVVVLSATGCDTVGMHTSAEKTIDFGPPMTLNVCLLQAPGVSAGRVDELLDAVNKEFAPYKIQVVAPWRHPWQRAGFMDETIINDVFGRDLEAPCDRLIALVDRNAGDFVSDLLVGEMLGSLDGTTRTHGFIVANFGTIDQLFSPPSAVTVHAFYHLIGCPDSLTLTKCYLEIGELKKHTDPAKGFVPGIDAKGQFLFTRAEVNARLRLAIAVKGASWQEMTLEQQYDLEWTADCQSKSSVTATPALRRTSLARYRVVVCACVDESGTLTHDPVILTSSGVPKADAAAIKLAKAASGLYKPASSRDKPAGNCQRTSLTFKHTPT